MKKFNLLSVLAAAMITAFCNVSYADEGHVVSPALSSESCVVNGAETDGVTFLLREVHCNDSVLTLRIARQPNDTYTSLIDNQVDYSVKDPAFIHALEDASQYGSKILGTLCDVLSLTDERGHNILSEYQVDCERNDSLLIDTFHIFLPKKPVKQVNLELVFGVNEDLQCRFSQMSTVRLTITNQQSFLTGVARLTLDNGDYEEWPAAAKYRLLRLMNEHGILPGETYAALSGSTEAAIDEYILDRYGIASMPGDISVISLMRIASVEMGIYTDWPNSTWVWFSKLMFETGLWDESSDVDIYETPGHEAIPPEKAVEIAKEQLAGEGIAKAELDQALILWHYATHASDIERKDLTYIITFRFADKHERYVCLTPKGEIK